MYEIIDYIFKKLEKYTENLMTKWLRNIGDVFGHELALALKNAFENGIIINGSMENYNENREVK